VTDPEDVMRLVQAVIFNQPDEAMRECSLDHRPPLRPSLQTDTKVIRSWRDPPQ
jgi:hypothetical protein